MLQIKTLELCKTFFLVNKDSLNSCEIMIGNEYKITTRPKEIAQVLNDHYVQLKDPAGKNILILQCKVN